MRRRARTGRAHRLRSRSSALYAVLDVLALPVAGASVVDLPKLDQMLSNLRRYAGVLRSLGVRFRPPGLELSREQRWVLGRAYGPVAMEAEGGLDREEAVRAAKRLALGPRIVQRSGESRLRREVGEEAARELESGWRQAVIGAVLRREAAERVAQVASEAEIRLVLLKFAALEARSVVEPGVRGVGDVDCLVAERDGPQLHRRLRQAGFESVGLSGTEQHLPRLVHATYGAVEVHQVLLGVRLGAGRRESATLEALEGQGLLERAPGFRRGVFVPRREVLLAHALAHGLGQHGSQPRSYPLSWMLGDLIDLGVAGVELERGLGEEVLGWLHGAVPEEEVRATVELCRALAAGSDVGAQGFLESPPGVLLRHVVAGAFSEEYVEAQKLAVFRAGLTDRVRWWKVLGGIVGTTFFLTRGQIDAIYGRPRGRLGYLGRRVWRPFDLCGRLARYGGSFLRQRFQNWKRSG